MKYLYKNKIKTILTMAFAYGIFNIAKGYTAARRLEMGDNEWSSISMSDNVAIELKEDTLEFAAPVVNLLLLLLEEYEEFGYLVFEEEVSKAILDITGKILARASLINMPAGDFPEVFVNMLDEAISMLLIYILDDSLTEDSFDGLEVVGKLASHAYSEIMKALDGSAQTS